MCIAHGGDQFLEMRRYLQSCGGESAEVRVLRNQTARNGRTHNIFSDACVGVQAEVDAGDDVDLVYRAADPLCPTLHLREKPCHQRRGDRPLHHGPFGYLACQCQTQPAITSNIHWDMGAEWLEVQPPVGQAHHLAVYVHRGTTEKLPHNRDGLAHGLRRLATDKLHFGKTSDASPQAQHGSALSHFVQGRNGHSCQRWMARVWVGHHGAKLDVPGMYGGERQTRVHLTKKALISVPEGLIAARLLEAGQFDQACWRILREIEGTQAQIHATAPGLLLPHIIVSYRTCLFEKPPPVASLRAYVHMKRGALRAAQKNRGLPQNLLALIRARFLAVPH